MKITKEWLERKNACKEDIFWFENQKEDDVEKIVARLIAEKKYDLANWLITECLDKQSCVSYAAYAAKTANVAYAAYAAADAAADAAYAVYVAANAAANVAYAAYAATDTSDVANASDVAYIKTIKYGVKLLKKTKKS